MPFTLADAVADIERRFTVVEGLPCATSQTGEPYVEYGPGGIREQGIINYAHLHTTEEGAIRALCGVVTHFASFAPDGAALYWRIRPEVEKNVLYKDESLLMARPHFTPVPVFTVYARLLISDRPVIYPTLDALNRAK